MTDNDNELPRTRSKTEKYDKTMCIICQKPDGHTCKVAFKETRKTMLPVAQKLSDKTFLYNLTQLLMLMVLSPTMSYIITYTVQRQKDWLNQSQNLWKIMPKYWQILNC